jgi:hypothetical protein
MPEKRFKLTAGEIRPLTPGRGGRFATDHITVDGHRVGYMYREPAEGGFDSGWRFFSGLEADEYANNPENVAIYAVNTIANYDPDIIPLLDAPPGAAFARDARTGEFVAEPLESPRERCLSRYNTRKESQAATASLALTPPLSHLPNLSVANLKHIKFRKVQVGWNTKKVDGRWVPTFPNAQYIFSGRELAYLAALSAADGSDASIRAEARLGPMPHPPPPVSYEGIYEDSLRPVIDAGLAKEIVVDGTEVVEGFS